MNVRVHRADCNISRRSRETYIGDVECSCGDQDARPVVLEHTAP